jgi:hypothetical protein
MSDVKPLACKGVPGGKPCGRSYPITDMCDGKGNFIGWCVYCDEGKAPPAELPLNKPVPMFLVTFPGGGFQLFAEDQNVTAPKVAAENNGQLFKVEVKITRATVLDPLELLS